MSQLAIKAGEALYCFLQLATGASDRYISAQIFDNNGNPLGSSFTLTNKGGGVYFDNSQLMPNQAIIVVRYKVFLDAGLTSLSDDDGDTLDIFVREDISQLIQSNESFIGVIEQSADNQIEAIAEGDEGITADFEDITGAIILETRDDSDRVTGEIEENGNEFLAIIEHI